MNEAVVGEPGKAEEATWCQNRACEQLGPVGAPRDIGGLETRLARLGQIGRLDPRFAEIAKQFR